jgi:hypothetical protein
MTQCCYQQLFLPYSKILQYPYFTIHAHFLTLYYRARLQTIQIATLHFTIYNANIHKGVFKYMMSTLNGPVSNYARQGFPLFRSIVDLKSTRLLQSFMLVFPKFLSSNVRF